MRLAELEYVHEIGAYRIKQLVEAPEDLINFQIAMWNPAMVRAAPSHVSGPTHYSLDGLTFVERPVPPVVPSVVAVGAVVEVSGFTPGIEIVVRDAKGEEVGRSIVQESGTIQLNFVEVGEWTVSVSPAFPIQSAVYLVESIES